MSVRGTVEKDGNIDTAARWHIAVGMSDVGPGVSGRWWTGSDSALNGCEVLTDSTSPLGDVTHTVGSA